MYFGVVSGPPPLDLGSDLDFCVGVVYTAWTVVVLGVA